MKIHEIGIEKSILDEIKVGRKTIEVRLAKPRFKTFQTGDKLKFREDIWQNGKIVKSRKTNLTAKITNIEFFTSFKEVMKKVDFKAVYPNAKSLEETLQNLRMFYGESEEKKFGIVIFHFVLLV